MIKPKVILLDFDKVISKSRYFSEIYSEKFGLDLNLMLPFFDNMRETAIVGKGDLKELLAEVKSLWQWEGTIDELMAFWFSADCQIDSRFIHFADQIHSNNIKLYLATDQEKYRSDYIWNELDLKNWMDDRFISYEIGYSKRNPEFFKSVIRSLNLKPKEIIFFDDSNAKVESARSVGIKAYVYNNFEDFSKKIQKIFNITFYEKTT